MGRDIVYHAIPPPGPYGDKKKLGGRITTVTEDDPFNRSVDPLSRLVVPLSHLDDPLNLLSINGMIRNKENAYEIRLNALPNLPFFSLYLIHKVHIVTHSTVVFNYRASCDADCQNNAVFILLIVCVVVPFGKCFTKFSP